MNIKTKTFNIGKVFNPLRSQIGRPKLVYKKLTLLYPSRLNAMALDPGKVNVNKSGIYTPGEIIFPVKIFKKVIIEARKDSQVIIDTKNGRFQLVLHSVRLMQKALSIKHGFTVFLEQDHDIKHAGLGSSSGTIAAVATAINELYDNPITSFDLIAYLAQNHGEEIAKDDTKLQHVQCIGGSAAAGLVKNGMIVLAGSSLPIASMNVSEHLDVVIGIPADFKAPDAKKLMTLEMRNMHKFIATGKLYGPRIAYEIVHRTLPAMIQGELKDASRIIFEYRFHYGSINNCSFVYPRMKSMAKKLEKLFIDADIFTLALSSVGPAFFAITSNKKLCSATFKSLGMNVIVTKPQNDGYKIVSKKPI